MLVTVSELLALRVRGLDGAVGRVGDVHFDDQDWSVHHLVVVPRSSQARRGVLVPPAAVRGIDRGRRCLDLALARAAVEAGAPVDADPPVSRQQHVALSGYFGFPYDWGGPMFHPGGIDALPDGLRHLRSARAVLGYRVALSGADLGRIADFALDQATWRVRLAVVRAGRGRHAHETLVSTDQIAKVSWEGREVLLEPTAGERGARPPGDFATAS